jgi:integrase
VARTVRDSRLETREARRRLAPQHEPYWRLVHEGLHLGYRKGPRGGVWLSRQYVDGRYIKKVIGAADDHADADGDRNLSYRQAQTRVLRRDDEVQAQSTGEKSLLTVAEAAERYMAWYRDHRRGLRQTESTINSLILPAFGERLVSEITTKGVKAWHTKLATLPPRRRSKKGQKQAYGEAPNTEDAKRARRATANRVLTVLRAILNKAFEDELVADNVAWRRIKPFKGADEPVIRFLTDDEARRLVNACRSDLRQLVIAALATGCRFGELVALKVADVNIDLGAIYVRPSKSGKGRHVPLNAESQPFFKSIIAGKAGAVHVFVKADGSPWGENHGLRPLHQACTNAKITPAISFHGLRHSYASALARAGVDLLTISKLLGHSDTRITSRHYAHLCDSTLAAAVSKLPKLGIAPDRKVRAIR